MNTVHINLIVSSAIFLLVLFLVFPLVQVPAQYSLSYVEGWNAYFGSIAASERPLYENVLLSPSYPPLSFYILGFLGKAFGSSVFVGRMVSVIAVLIVLIGVFLILKKLSQSPRLSLLGALWAPILFLILAPDYIGMNSPQFLGHAVMMGAMLLYVKFRSTEQPQWSLLFVTALCALTALYIKHNILAFPLAISLDLLFSSRKKFIFWCLFFFGIGAAVLLLLDQFFGGRLIPSLLAKRQYSFELLIRHIPFAAVVLLVPLLCSIRAALKIIKTPEWRWVGYYFFISLGIGIMAYGGFGIDVNLFFDFIIAVGILSPLATHESSFYLGKHVAWAMIAFLFLGSVARLATAPSKESRAIKADAYMKDVNYVSSIEGSAICEDLLLCYWAKKQLLLEPFMVSQGMRTHELNEEAILDSIRQKQWAIVQLNRPEVPNRFTESFLETLHENYAAQPTESAQTRVFYLPK